MSVITASFRRGYRRRREPTSSFRLYLRDVVFVNYASNFD